MLRNMLRNKISMQKNILKSFLIAALFFFFGIAQASADTHYVRKTGSDSGDCISTACLSVNYGISKMSSGDTLVIGDGTYTEVIPIYGVPIPSGYAGSPDVYTTVQAENNQAVTINGTLTVGGAYIKVDGIKINASGAGFAVSAYGANHIKFIRCSAYGTVNTGNVSVFDATNSSYILFEECWAWGTGRYKFLAYQSDHVIFRRCVSRHDYHTGDFSNQCANFTTYDATDFLIQNSIGINSGLANRSNGQLYGSVWSENNANVVNSGKIVGNIFLNIRGLGAINDYKHVGAAERVIEDNVVWNSEGGIFVGIQDGTAATSLINRTTVGDIIGPQDDTSFVWGVGVMAGDYWSHYPAGQAVINNSIIDNSERYGISEWLTSDYNDVNGSGLANWGGRWQSPLQGTNDIAVDPKINGLKYLPRIEDPSILKTAGIGGGQMGAQIINKRGTDGALWGEAGYDTLTTDSLWPFPNEDLIKSDFASYSGPGPAGARGFATGTSIDDSPQTLTKYIWEYLGNQIPGEIYGTCSGDVIAPGAPGGLSVL